MKTAKEIHNIMQMPMLKAAFEEITDSCGYSDSAATTLSAIENNEDLWRSVYDAICAEQELMFYCGLSEGLKMALALDLRAINDPIKE